MRSHAIEHLRGVGNAEYYAEWYGTRDWRWYSWLVASVVRECTPGAVLDLGCGTGLAVEAAHRWGMEWIGVEASHDAVRLARERGQDAITHFDGRRLPFRSGAFSTVVSHEVIEHVSPDYYEPLLREITRVLARGGSLYVTSPNRLNHRLAAEDPTHVNLRTPRELVADLHRVGFTNVRTTNVLRDFLGGSRLGRSAVRAAYRATRLDVLSATANAIARLPE